MLKKVFLILFLLLFGPPAVFAADFEVDCSVAGCVSSGQSPLFLNSEIWYPGKNLTKTFSLKNSSAETREMAFRGRKTSTGDLLEEVINLKLDCGNKTLWEGSLKSFYILEKISLGTFTPESSIDCRLSVSMDLSANNDYQEQSSVFDLDFGFWGEPIIPTPTSTKPSADTATVLGAAAASTPACADVKPGLPLNFTAVLGPAADQVTLSWESPLPPYTHFLAAYGDNPDNPKWGNPNVGRGNSYIVSELGAGRYWFWIRAENGCMPGEFTGPVFVSFGGEVAGESTVAIDFTEEVLGDKIETQEPEGLLGGGIATEMGQVKGETTKRFPCWLFWLIIVLVLLLAGTYLYLRRKRAHRNSVLT